MNKKTIAFMAIPALIILVSLAFILCKTNDASNGGTLVVEYRDDENNVIQEKEIKSGVKIGEETQVKALEIRDYELKDTNEKTVVLNEKGEIKKVVFTYTSNPSSQRGKKAKESDNNEGNEAQMNITTSGDDSGEGDGGGHDSYSNRGIGDNIQAKKAGTVTIRYLDEEGNAIKTKRVDTDLALNKEFAFTAENLMGYEIVGNMMQKVILTTASPTQEIIFQYRIKKGIILVKHLDEKGEYIRGDRVIDNVKLNEEITVTAANVSNYQVVGNSSQKVLLDKTDSQKVAFVYTRKRGTVTVKYQDEKGSEIADRLVDKDVLFGIEKAFMAKEIDGYIKTGNTTQKVTLSDVLAKKEIVFTYKKIGEPVPVGGTVTVKYVDTNKVEIASSDEVTGVAYHMPKTFTAKVIAGYRLSGNETQTVTLTESNQHATITFVYTKMQDKGVFVVKYVDENNKPIPGLEEERVEASPGVETVIQAKPTADYYRVSPGEVKDKLTSGEETKEIIFHYEKIQDADKYSYIAIVYTDTTKSVKENAQLKFYVSDYEQSDYLEENKTKKFRIILTLNGVQKEFEKSIGDVTLDLGKLSEGEYIYTAQAIDLSNGRKSQELYGEFRVLDLEKEQAEIDANTYRVTDEDLAAYGIKNDDDINNALATKNGIKKLIADKSEAGYRKLVMQPGVYVVEIEERTQNGAYYPTNIIHIPSNFTLDLNGATLKMKPTPLTQQKGTVITMDKVYDAHLINGTLVGDNREKNLEGMADGNKYGEHIQAGGIVGGSKYCSWENITVTNFSGYAVITGLAHTTEHAILENHLKVWESGELDDNGNVVPRCNKFTSAWMDLSKKFADVDTIRIGQYLGYQFSPSGQEWNIDVAFYDENKNLIEKKIGNQYREIIKPVNAKYMRCSFVALNSEQLNSVSLYHLYVPRNCEIKEVTFDDNRTCGLAPFQGNDLLIEGCKFIKTARRITPVAIDFEDGWYLMQDYCLRKCEVVEPAGTADIVIVGGINLQFRENKNFRLHANHLTVGLVIEDNEELYSLTRITDRVNSGYYRFQRNHFRSTGKAINSTESYNRTIPFIIKDCNYFESTADGNLYDKFVRCTFDYNNVEFPTDRGGTISGYFEDCVIKNFNSPNGKSLGVGNAVLVNCDFINNNTMLLQGDIKFIDSRVDGFKFWNYTSPSASVTAINSDLKDVYFERLAFLNTKVWLDFKDSTLTNTIRPNVISDNFVYLDKAQDFLRVKTSNVTLNNGSLLVTQKLRDARNPYINLDEMR